MRIGLVCPYSLASPGGVQQHVLGLAAALGQAGHAVSVLAPDAPGAVGPVKLVNTGRSIPLPYKGAVGRVSFGPVTYARVKRWLQSGEFDLVHVHEPLTPSASLITVGLSTVPVVATFHTAQDRPRALASSAVVFRHWLRRIDAHIAVSQTAARTMRDYLPDEPVIIPNGLDVAGYDGPRMRGGNTVLFLGRLDEPRKGLPRLLEAWPQVRSQRPHSRLVLVGPGHPRQLPAGVETTGTVSEQAKRQLLRDADILVAPNTHGESFGYVLVEAMASGTPVLAHGLRAFADVLDHGRLGALYARHSELAPALVELLGDPQRRKQLSQDASAAVRAYDWSVVMPRVLDVYREVVGLSRESAPRTK